jgi:hypothetical protein
VSIMFMVLWALLFCWAVYNYLHAGTAPISSSNIHGHL